MWKFAVGLDQEGIEEPDYRISVLSVVSEQVVSAGSVFPVLKRAPGAWCPGE